MSWRRAAARAASLLAVLLISAGCVGPATSPEVYAAKAGQTGSAAVSSARTAVLAVQTQQRDSLTAAAFEVLLQESEAALDSVTSTFGSIQPPDTAAADQLSRELTALLGDALDDARELRIAARRGDPEQIDLHARRLAETADQIESLTQGLS